MSSTTQEPAVTPKLGPTGKPIRRGRWTFVSHQWNGDVWRLDGTTLDLEHDSLEGWVLYENGRYREPVGKYLLPSMFTVQQEHDRRQREAHGNVKPSDAYL